ncbi:MAG: hypothetical protein ABWZ52_06995 [Acidimicrobiales bacterium]
MLRRLTLFLALVLVALLASASPAMAHVELETGEVPDGVDTTTTTEAPSTSTTADLPGTTVEAANEGDGDAAAPWLIGAGIAAIASIAIGGSLLKRRMDGDSADATSDASDGSVSGEPPSG